MIIYLSGLYQLQTKGTLYFPDEYANLLMIPPNDKFAGSAAQLLFSRIVDIIENEGQKPA